MSARAPVRGRFAPSPTGRLHLGNVRSALLGWLQMRSVGGEFWLRIEDLDPERSKQEHVDGIFRDLEYLGLDWDGPVWRQSARAPIYDGVLQQLAKTGRTYGCICSRADVRRVAGAPHVGEEGPVYPGTCAHRTEYPAGKPVTVRFRVAPGVVSFEDELHGHVEQDVAREVGDFVLRRGDGVASYQLAVVVDDALAEVTHVLRADDLLLSTPRQIQLAQACGYALPRYAHVPLLLGADGKRLAKREGALTVAGLRDAGVPGAAIVGALAQWSGLGDGSPVTPTQLVAGFSLAKVSREPAVVTPQALEALARRR